LNTEIGSQKDGSTRRLKLTPRELEEILSEYRLEDALDRLLEDVLAAGRSCNVREEAIDAALPSRLGAQRDCRSYSAGCRHAVLAGGA